MLSELSKNSLFSDTDKGGDYPQGSDYLQGKEVGASSLAGEPFSQSVGPRAPLPQSRSRTIPIDKGNPMTNISPSGRERLARHYE